MKSVFPTLLTVLTLAACSTDTLEPALPRADVSEEAGWDAEIVEAPVVVLEEVAFGAGHRAPQAGVVTAGDIDDTLNLVAFRRYLGRTKGPELNFAGPVSAQVFAGRTTAPGVFYTLSRPGGSEPFYSGYTGVDGMITVFPSIMGQTSREVVLRLFQDGQQVQRDYRLTRGAPRSQIRISAGSDWAPDFVDMVLVVDATGSMGDELEWLEKDFVRSVSRALGQAGLRGASVRYGLVVYRDQGEDFVVRNYGFTRSARQMRQWLAAQRALGGGDYPEAAGQALETAVALPWRRGKGERLLLHVADAPAHSTRRYLRAAQAASGKGVQIFTLGASGVGEEAEHLMRQASAATAGRYVFLTDDSGVGNAHDEPDVACYQVTSLKDKLQSLLVSELTGRRRTSGRVIREVGAYRNGVCQN